MLRIRPPFVLLLFVLVGVGRGTLCAQVITTDSTYLRMSDGAKALAAIRFDMAAYNDTLRTYRDALDKASSRLDASTSSGEDRQARLGLLRRDAQQLGREMRALRKQLKRSSPSLEDAAHTAGGLVQRTKQLRGRLVADGVFGDQ